MHEDRDFTVTILAIILTVILVFAGVLSLQVNDLQRELAAVKAQTLDTKEYVLGLSSDQGFDMVYNHHMFNQIAEKTGIEIEEPDFAK